MDQAIKLDPAPSYRVYRSHTQQSFAGTTDGRRRFLEELGDDADVEDEWIYLLYTERKFGEALARAEALDLNPSTEPSAYAYNMFIRARLHQLLGDDDRATDCANRAIEVFGRLIEEGNRSIYVMGWLYVLAGRRADAIRSTEALVGTELGAKDSLLRTVYLRQAAHVYVSLGELDIAMGYLDRSLAQSGIYTIKDVELDPDWDPLREHPGYAEMIARYPLR